MEKNHQRHKDVVFTLAALKVKKQQLSRLKRERWNLVRCDLTWLMCARLFVLALFAVWLNSNVQIAIYCKIVRKCRLICTRERLKSIYLVSYVHSIDVFIKLHQFSSGINSWNDLCGVGTWNNNSKRKSNKSNWENIWHWITKLSLCVLLMHQASTTSTRTLFLLDSWFLIFVFQFFCLFSSDHNCWWFSSY